MVRRLAMKDGWVKGCLLWLGLLLAGWGIVILLGYIILRGVLSMMALFDAD